MRRLYWTVPFVLGLAMVVPFGIGWRQQQEVSIVISRYVAALREGDAVRAGKLLVPRAAEALRESLQRDGSSWCASPDLRHRVTEIHRIDTLARAEIVLIDADLEIPQSVELERQPAGAWRISGLSGPWHQGPAAEHAGFVDPRIAAELGEALNAEPGLLLERTARRQAESL